MDLKIGLQLLNLPLLPVPNVGRCHERGMPWPTNTGKNYVARKITDGLHSEPIRRSR